MDFSSEDETTDLKESLKVEQIQQKESFTQSVDLETQQSLNQSSSSLLSQIDLLSTNKLDEYELDQLKKQLQFNQIQSQLDVMPTCSERYCLLLIQTSFITLQQQQGSYDEEYITLQNQVEEIIKKLEDRLQIEDLGDSTIRQLMSSIKNKCSYKNWKIVAEETYLLYKIIRPFNTSELRYLVDKTKFAAELIEGKDVVMLFGGTGAGKSTTLHYLAGSQMIQQVAQLKDGERIEYYGPDPKTIKYEELKQVKVGPYAISETRYITPVSVNTRDLGLAQNEDIILCDSPGFGDTSGPEVDVANGIGIVQSLKKSKSIRPIILISYKSIGDRGQGIRELAQIIIGLVNDISDNASKFTYLYSKFPEKYDFKAEFTNIYDGNKIQDDFKGSSFDILFQSIISQNKRKAININLNDEPSDILEMIMKKNPIQDPSEVFKITTTQSSKEKVNNQLVRNEEIIYGAIKRNEYSLILYKLDEFLYLSELLDLEWIKDAYQKCKQAIISQISDRCNQQIDSFNKQMNDNDRICDEDIQKYLTFMSQLQEAQILKDHLGTDLISTSYLTNNLQQQINNISSQLQKPLTNSSDNQYILKLISKAQTLSSYFKEVKDTYDEICQNFILKYQDCLKNSKNLLESDDLIEFFKSISQIQKLEKSAGIYLDLENQTQRSESILLLFAQKMNNTVLEIKDLIDKIENIQDDSNQRQLKLMLEYIELCDKYLDQNKHLDFNKIEDWNYDRLKSLKKALHTYILDKCTKISENIQAFLSDDEIQFDEIQEIVVIIQKLNEFKLINGIQSLLNNVINLIIDFIKLQKKKDTQIINQQIDKQHLLDDKINFQQVKTRLDMYQQGIWIEDFSKGIIKKSMEQIIKGLIKQASSLLMILKSIKINIQHSEDLQISAKIIYQFDYISKLKLENVEVNSIFYEAKDLFQKSCSSSLNEIKQFFTNQKEKINSNQKDLNLFIDQVQAEKSINYLNNYIQFIEFEKDLAKAQYQEACNILNEYGTLIRTQFDKNLALLNDETPSTEENLFSNILHVIISCVEVIKNLEKENLIFKLIQGEEISKFMKVHLSDYYETLKFEKKSQNLKILKSFRRIDEFMDKEESFSQLYKELVRQSNDQQQNGLDNIATLMYNKQYQLAKKELQLVDTVWKEKNKEELAYIINEPLSSLIKQTNKLLWDLDVSDWSNSIQNITDNLGQYNNAKQFLNSYLSKTVEDLYQCLLVELKNKLQYQIKLANDLINNFEFTKVEKQKIQINQSLKFVEDYFKSEEISEFRRKFEELDQQILGEFKRYAENLEVKSLSKDFLGSSQSLFKNFYEAYQNQQRYSNWISGTIKSLKNQIKQALDDLNSAETWEIGDTILKSIEEALDLIPVQNRDANMKQKFEQIKTERQQKLEKIKSKMQEIKKTRKNPECNQKDILKQEYDYIQDCKNNKMEEQADQIMKEKITQSVELCSQATSCLESNQVQESLEKYQQLINQYDYFKEKKEISENFVNQKTKFELKLQLINNYFNELQTKAPDSAITQFENFILLVGFNLKAINTSDSSFMYSSKQFNEMYIQTFKQISSFFKNNQKLLSESLANLSFQKVNIQLQISGQWNQFLEIYLSKTVSISNLDSLTIQEVKLVQSECGTYEQNKNNVIIQVKATQAYFKNFQIQNFLHEGKRIEVYKELKFKMNALKDINDICEHFEESELQPQIIYNECAQNIQQKFQNISQEIVDTLKNESWDIDQLKTLKVQLENIQTFEQNEILVSSEPLSYLEKIDQAMTKRLQQSTNKITNENENIEVVANNLIQLKNLSLNIYSFRHQIDKQIDSSLKEFRKVHQSDKGKSLSILTEFLQQEDDTGIGKQLVQDSNFFKGAQVCMFNERIQKHDIKYVLNQMKDYSDVDTSRLQQQFDKCMELYQKTVTKSIIELEKKVSKTQVIQSIIVKVRETLSRIEISESLKWDNSIIEIIHQILAYIFALWTIRNSEYYEEMEAVSDKKQRDNYLVKPHPGQIVCILRLLGIGYKNSKGLFSNLVELGTGEGKSIVLAAVSTIFALFGFKVKCACYSQQLSKRDYEAFLFLFDSLEITSQIEYGSFTQICESMINSNGDIRKRVLDLINNVPDIEKSSSSLRVTQSILLIDEVDVFFGKDFYGSLYSPVALLKDSTIANLIQYLWKIKDDIPPLSEIMKSSEYTKCCEKYPKWIELINESVKDMLSDLINYKHEYVVQSNKIGYREHDTVSFSIQYGYKTMFAYFYENGMKNISDESLNENIYIRIKCGHFSYAEIPRDFKYIMGVTGTLKSLSDPEKDIVEKVYKIENKTFIPSVFGSNQRKFAEKSDVYVEEKIDYFKIIIREINKIEKQDRAVLVFFDTIENLNIFYNSEEANSIRHQIQVLTEDIPTQSERDQIIRQATICGSITLSTRVYGRGIDFILRDDKVILNGGLHVIQAFFSDQLSEEIQIKGRCARQGEQGSFSMILLDQELEFVLGSQYRNEVIKMRSSNSFYEDLSLKRNALAKDRFKDIKQLISELFEEHKKSQQLVTYINLKQQIQIVKILKVINEGHYEEAKEVVSNILCLVDATGSMGKLLEKAAQTVVVMFERVIEILKEKGIKGDSFKLQFAVYRDYDSLQEGILEFSPWESNPQNLKTFLQSIKPKGGGDYEEAIEIGLQHANKEHKNNPLSQVMLIGDAPSKEMKAIQEYRQSYKGEDYWAKSKYGLATHWKTEAQILKDNKIPVSTFYLHAGAKTNFEEIASITGGKSQLLEINLPNSSDILTEVVCIQILYSISVAKEKNADDLIKVYTKKYGTGKSYS